MRCAALLALFACLALAGCAGSGDGEPEALTTRAKETMPPETTTEEPPSLVAPIVARLNAAGFMAQENQVDDETSPVALGEFEVSLGSGRVRGYVYGSAADARRSTREFASVERDFPDQFEVRRVGRVLYVGTVEEPAKLPMREYLRVVKVGGDAA